MPALLPLPPRTPLRRGGAGSAALREERREAPQPLSKRSSSDAAEAPGVPVSLETPTPRVAVTRAVDREKAAKIAGHVAVVGDSRAEPGALLRALTQLRQDLATQTSPPIQETLDAGAAVQLAARLADAATSVPARLEATWVLTNLATGTSAQTRALVEAGAHEALIAALSAPASAERPDLCDQCLWALGNIAGDADASLRDRLLSAGVVGALGRLFEQMAGFGWDLNGRAQVLRTMTWLMSSLCRGQPAPQLEDVDCCFDYFVQVLAGTEDPTMLSEALWGLSYLLEGAAGDEDGNARAQRLLSAGFDPSEVPQPPAQHPTLAQVVRCAKRLGDPRSPLLVPALRLLGALLSLSAPAVTDAVMAAGALQALRGILADAQAPAQLRRDAAWALSNIAAGTQAQAQRLLEEPGVWEALCSGMEDSQGKVRRECAWAVASVALRGLAALPVHPRLDARKVLRLVAACLRGGDGRGRGEAEESFLDAGLQRALLDAGEAALRYGDEQVLTKGLMENPLAAAAEEYGLPAELEALQRKATDEGVARKAAYLAAAWFGPESESELEKEKSPSARSCGGTPSAICGGSPMRRAAYQFGA